MTSEVTVVGKAGPMDQIKNKLDFEGCCQSNRNQSPFDAPRGKRRQPQAASDCHSASATERRILYV